MKAVAYLRCSTDEQDLGIEAQRAAVVSWCAREGARLVAEHADEGLCGALPMDRRPGLLSAVMSLKRGWVLVVAKRDRLSRNPDVTSCIVMDVKDRRARVVCADGGNGEDANDVLMRRLKDAFAEYERAQIRMRTSSALKAKQRRGEAAGGKAPYGYGIADGGPHPRDAARRLRVLVENPSERAVLARMRELRARGLGFGAVASELNAAGLRLREGGMWTRQVVAKVLRRAS